MPNICNVFIINCTKYIKLNIMINNKIINNFKNES